MSRRARYGGANCDKNVDNRASNTRKKRREKKRKRVREREREKWESEREKEESEEILLKEGRGRKREREMLWAKRLRASDFHYAKPQMESCYRVSLPRLHDGPRGWITLPRNEISFLEIEPLLTPTTTMWQRQMYYQSREKCCFLQ